MTTVEALKALAVTMKGSGTVDDVPGETISDVIEYISDNWEAIKTAIKGEQA